MAVNCSKQLFFKTLHRNKQRNVIPLLVQGTNFQFFGSVLNYSDYDPTRMKISKAMQSFLEKTAKHDQFIKEQLEEFNIGKKYLANMMGVPVEELTQAKINESIEYLFPSALFVPKARPIMKPPSEVYKERKAAAFDYTGRPYHFLYYTSKQNFSQILHDAAKHLEELNMWEQKNPGLSPEKKLTLAGGEWISLADLQEKLLEKIYELEYEKFIEVLERLLAHPYAYQVESFLRSYWRAIESEKQLEAAEPEVQKDGSLVVTIPRAQRKTSVACVKVTYPGDGQIQINGIGIDYFLNVYCREQILFPLVLTEMLRKVNIDATVTKGGESSQAGAIRLGISLGLQPFVTKDVALKMQTAGLLQRDVRKRERKKPGQEGARRRYTWLKR